MHAHHKVNYRACTKCNQQLLQIRVSIGYFSGLFLGLVAYSVITGSSPIFRYGMAFGIVIIPWMTRYELTIHQKLVTRSIGPPYGDFIASASLVLIVTLEETFFTELCGMGIALSLSVIPIVFYSVVTLVRVELNDHPPEGHWTPRQPRRTHKQITPTVPPYALQQ